MGNFFPIMALNYGSLYHSIFSREFFQSPQNGRRKWQRKWQKKAPEVKFSKKILFWAKWQILVQLWSKITQACISGSVLKIFLKLCHLAQQLDKNHFYLKIFPKKSFFEPSGYFWPGHSQNLSNPISQDPR